MPTNRTVLRRAIGDKLGDMLVLKATANSANASSFIDVVRMGDRGDRAPSIVNRIGYLSGGTAANLGHECRITDFASSARTLTFTPAAATAPQVGDELELWSMTERVGSIDAIHRLINDAIRAVDRWAEIETWDTAQTYNARTQTLTIPATWVEFGGADWTDGRGYVKPIPNSRLRVRPGLRTVEILGHSASRANRRAVRLWGFPRSPALTTDDATTNVDSEWLVESVVSVISLAGAWKATDGAAAERRANFWNAQAMLYRRSVAAPRRGLGMALV